MKIYDLSIQILVVSLLYSRAAVSVFRSLHFSDLSRAILDEPDSTRAYVPVL